jgi:hypothetical protein
MNAAFIGQLGGGGDKFRAARLLEILRSSVELIERPSKSLRPRRFSSHAMTVEKKTE